MESVCHQFGIEGGQDGNYMQSVCDNTVINCNKLAQITNLLPSTFTEVSIKYLQSPTRTSQI